MTPCHDTEAALIGDVGDFEDHVNADPVVLTDRLRIRTKPVPVEEELRIS